MIYWRWGKLATSPRLTSPVSREGAFLFNNVVFLGLMFATFWGTVFPILNELVTGQKITVGAPFFNRVNAPLGIGLLLLLAVGPVMSWGKASRRNFQRNLRDPLIVSVVTAIVVTIAGVRAPFAIFTWAFCVFATGTMGLEVVRGVRGRMQRKQESPIRALLNLIRANRRRYGGYIVHVGVVLLFIGITGNLFARETQVSMKPGDVTTFEGYRLELKEIRHRYQPNYSAQLALFDVEGRGRTIQMWPEKRQYVGPRGETSTEVAIWSSLFEDLYLIFVSEDPDTGTAIFRFHRNPLVMWIWIGGMVMIFGGIVAIRRKGEQAG
ncbi:MAG: hypothetical protein D6761_07270 [Candidatus Dadabacteria bacterium]|nr:MAG: hypothetical protein D6761_07270 [Candidatus Dadabacteria bacterium]